MATTPPLRQPIRSASTTLGTPPSSAKHSASIAMVVSARSSPANRTNRTRDHASTAQNTCSPPRLPQLDHQHLTRRPHRRPPATVMLHPPRMLPRRDKPPEVPCRTGIPRGPCLRQQPLRRDPSLGLVDPGGHQLGHRVVVVAPRHPNRRAATGLMPGDHPPHRLRRGTAHLSGTTVTTHLTIGGNDVHPIPRRLQWELLGGAVTGWHRHRHRPGPKLQVDTTSEG